MTCPYLNQEGPCSGCYVSPVDDGKIILETKSWLRTGWMHGVAVKGYRTDCIQFITEVAKKMGWIPGGYEVPKYRQDWALHNSESIMLREVVKFCRPIFPKDMVVGDVLLFRTGRCAAHAALYIGEGKMIEANIRSGVEETFLKEKKDFHSAWRAKARCV